MSANPPTTYLPRCSHLTTSTLQTSSDRNMRREETTQTTHMTTNTHTKHHKTRLKHGDAKHAPPPPAQTPTGITPHHHTTNWQGRQWFFVCTGFRYPGGYVVCARMGVLRLVWLVGGVFGVCRLFVRIGFFGCGSVCRVFVGCWGCGCPSRVSRRG